MTRFLRGMVLRVFYPLGMVIGAFSKGGKERLQLAVVDINNRLVRSEWKGRRNGRGRDPIPERPTLLLLLPHCLQVSECDIRLTYNVGNCKRCGRCEMKDLLGVADEKGIEIFVATGGTIARRIVKEVMPDVIVAVACERDLSSGIADTYPLPVLGITNDRPFGPCRNTRVDLEKVKEALIFFGG